MIIGVPKEIKNHEYRVGLTPESVEELVKDGHRVIIETSAGIGIGASDTSYKKAGASIAMNASEVFRDSEMIVKVKEPQALERKMLKQGQVLFTYLHLAPDLQQTIDLIESKAICIAYETVTDKQGGLPLLKPMSQVAGRLAIQVGAAALQKNGGGRGVLLGGVPGVAPANVLIIGGGDVGFNAAQMAVGLQANVTILDRSNDVMKGLNRHFGVTANVIRSTPAVLEEKLKTADLVVGAVLIPGAEAPKLITRKMLSLMMEGSVLVDVAIDQGGCFETSKATTHEAPTYIVDGVVHYCVANMPGGVARTATMALTNATLPFALALANKGIKQALLDDAHLLNGLNVHKGKVTYKAVADVLSYDYGNPKALLLAAG